MADDKEMIRKDLAVILKLDAQIDYSQKNIVEKYYKDIMEKALLTTPHGKKYIKRLEQIINGDIVNDKCIFCNSQTQGDTMICPVCMAKLQKPSTVYCRSCGNKMTANSLTCPMCGKDRDDGYKYCAHCGKEVPMPNVETFTNDIKNKFKAFAEQAAKITKENVQDITEKGTKFAENIAADAKAKNAFSKMITLWKKRSKRNKIMIAAVVAIIVCIMLSGGKGAISISKSVDSKEKGEKLVREILPDSDYKITGSSSSTWPEYEFNVKVGDFCSNGKPAPGTINVYVYTITSRNPPAYAHCIVAEDGRIIGNGTILSDILPDEYRRIK